VCKSRAHMFYCSSSTILRFRSYEIAAGGRRIRLFLHRGFGRDLARSWLGTKRPRPEAMFHVSTPEDKAVDCGRPAMSACGQSAHDGPEGAGDSERAAASGAIEANAGKLIPAKPPRETSKPLPAPGVVDHVTFFQGAFKGLSSW
jgi:hypothetical protein